MTNPSAKSARFCPCLTFVICFPSWAKNNFLGQNLAYLADFWFWAFYMRNPALSLSFSLFLSFSLSLFLSFSMSISLSISISSSPPQKNTSDVLTTRALTLYRTPGLRWDTLRASPAATALQQRWLVSAETPEEVSSSSMQAPALPSICCRQEFGAAAPFFPDFSCKRRP